MANKFWREDTLASKFEFAYEQYKQYPDSPGVDEAMEHAWDIMIDAVEAANHETDHCPCKSCDYYRDGVTE